MKTSKFTHEQILATLRQAVAGPPAADICRRLGVNEVRELLVDERVDSTTWQLARIDGRSVGTRVLVGPLRVGTGVARQVRWGEVARR